MVNSIGKRSIKTGQQHQTRQKQTAFRLVHDLHGRAQINEKSKRQKERNDNEIRRFY